MHFTFYSTAMKLISIVGAWMFEQATFLASGDSAVSQRLKPRTYCSFYGRAEAHPLQKQNQTVPVAAAGSQLIGPR
jgi:hypothetical protein